MKQHAVPFESLDMVEDFVARVRNVVPEASVAFEDKPKMGSPYVIIHVHRGMDTFTLIAEPEDTVRVFEDRVWITKPEFKL